MRLRLLPAAAFCIATFIAPVQSGAQCSKTWVRKKCVPKITPFVHNGQMNSTVLSEGQTTKLDVTFYSGQDYRVLVCAEETLENVSFRIYDASDKIFFDSKDHNNTDVWDFRVKTTAKVKVEVVVDDNEDKAVQSGCVSILIGFKK